MRHSLNKNLRIYTLITLILIGVGAEAQTTYNALFLGNSYTGFNNLPKLTSDLARSAGDSLNIDSYTPGGYRLVDHTNDFVSLDKIANGNWDFVVFQEQSQHPITDNQSFRYNARALYDHTKLYLPCAVLMPYMTWGRKNGDASKCPTFPVMCTYEGMDSTLRNAYLHVAENDVFGEVSPVSVVWRYIRDNHPSIELYAADGSHPSVAGSYAAACCFYSAIFKKDPTLITDDYGLDPSEAQQIRIAAQQVVFNQLNVWDFQTLPTPNISYILGSGFNEVYFNTQGYNVHRYFYWDFGDGNSSTLQQPVHSYATNGSFNVTLYTYRCNQYGSDTTMVDMTLTFCNHTPTVYSQLPAQCLDDTLWTQPANTFQWYAGNAGLLAGENQQYIKTSKYPGELEFSVRTSVNGCSELSVGFFKNTISYHLFYHNFGLGMSGPDPCNWDTATMHAVPRDYTVTLNGSETIQWFKNGNLLPQWTNEDTLLITEGGTYHGWIVDTTSVCPKDTTFSMTVFYDCGTLGVSEPENESEITIYPNPASDYIFLELNQAIEIQQPLKIYSISGVLVKELILEFPGTEISLKELSAGIYFVQLDGHSSIKLVKQ